MGDNLFNTFSFNVWKSNKEEEEKEKRNKKRRKKQVAKLKKALKEKKLGTKGPGGSSSSKGGGGGDGGDIERVLRMLIDEGDSDFDEEDGESDIDPDLLDEVRKDAYYQPGQPGAPPSATPTSMMATPSPAHPTPVPMMMVPNGSPAPPPMAQTPDGGGGSGWRHNRPPGALSQMGNYAATPTPQPRVYR